MSTQVPTRASFACLAELPVHVEGYELHGLELRVSDEFTRHSTVVHLHGLGQEGQGEDTTYAPPDQIAFRAAGPNLRLDGAWTLESFSAHLGRLPLFPAAPSSPDFLNFRRWAFESAALDLALRQANLSLADALGRTPQPVTFVVSPGPEDTADGVLSRLGRYPDLRFKLMATSEWDDATVDALAATGAVDVVDLKGRYEPSVPVAVRPDPALYRRVVRAFTDAWIEDPGITPATEPVLRGQRHRITWDAPIHHSDDLLGQPIRARTINMKPSRFGSIRALLDAYDFCERAGIGAYGGGQFELGPGRAQIQLLASLFHPHAPNDVAPSAFNEPVLRDDLPASPLPAPCSSVGFGEPLP